MNTTFIISLRKNLETKEITGSIIYDKNNAREDTIEVLKEKAEELNMTLSGDYLDGYEGGTHVSKEQGKEHLNTCVSSSYVNLKKGRFNQLYNEALNNIMDNKLVEKICVSNTYTDYIKDKWGDDDKTYKPYLYLKKDVHDGTSTDYGYENDITLTTYCDTLEEVEGIISKHDNIIKGMVEDKIKELQNLPVMKG